MPTTTTQTGAGLTGDQALHWLVHAFAAAFAPAAIIALPAAITWADLVDVCEEMQDAALLNAAIPSLPLPDALLTIADESARDALLATGWPAAIAAARAHANRTPDAEDDTVLDNLLSALWTIALRNAVRVAGSALLEATATSNEPTKDRTIARGIADSALATAVESAHARLAAA